MRDFFRRLFSPERRWLLVTVIVGIGAIILFNLFPRGGSGQQRGAPIETGPSEQLQAAQLQAQVALAQSQQQAQVAMSAQAAELASRELEAQVALALGDQRADIEAASIAAELQAIREQSNTELAVAGLQTEIELAGIEAASANQQALISSQEAMAQIQAESNLATQMLFTELQRQQSADETARFLGMFEAQRDIAIYEEAAEVERERIEAETERLGIRTQGRNQDRQGSRNFWGNIIGAGASLLGGFLSDIRAKENVEWIGVRDDGLNNYRYNYVGGTFEHAGPMAQEVEGLYPHLVYDDPNTGLKHVHAEGLG